MTGTRAAVWTQVPITVEVDLAHGGRWTSLRAGAREWLWHRPDERRARVRPGDPFVDAGGGEECLPTVRGEPDHGAAWSRPWDGVPSDAGVTLDRLRLRRRLSHDGGALTATYDLTGPPGTPFVHATHLLLDVGVDAYADAEAGRVVVVDDPRPAGAQVSWTGAPLEAAWPDPWGLPLHRFGADDGTAVAMVLPDCRAVTVVDGEHTVRLSLSPVTGDVPLSTALWRNLGGWPAEAPYRSVGVEPMVGTGLVASDPGAAAVLPADGRVSWALRCTASRRAR